MTRVGQSTLVSRVKPLTVSSLERREDASDKIQDTSVHIAWIPHIAEKNC